MSEPRAVELSVIVPCFNEEGHLPDLVERTERVFDRRGIAGEIVLVNDGSRDRTGLEVEALAASHARVVARHHAENRGIPAGWATGLAASRGRYVLTIDADLQYQPEAIAQLWREMCFSRVDLVQGWRSPLERKRDARYLMSRGLDHLLKLVFEMPQHDVKSGFILYKREVFEEILAHAPGYFYFQTFVTVVAKAKGYSIRQVETFFDERRVGRSFMSRVPLGVAAKTVADIARAALEFRVREPKEQVLALAVRGAPERPASAPPVERGWRQRYLGLYGALMPVHHWMISRNAVAYLEELRRTQWLPRAEIEQLQLRRLARLVQHAYDHVGWYRELFQTHGIEPGDIRTFDDLRRIPVLTKQMLRENLYFDLLSDNHDKRKILKVVTSGSTGEPLALFCDRFQLDMRWANTFRNVEWTGYRFPDRQVRLWHATIGLNRGQAMKEHLDAFLSGRKFFSVFALDDATIRRYLAYVRRTRPALLDGYAEAFNVIATFLAREPTRDLRAGAIISSAQTMPPETRALVERAFGCLVYDKYGAREFSGIAHECEAHRGHHVNAESYIVEVVRDGRAAKEGEVGEVLVTDLNNRCVPLLRYRLGDLAVATATPCPCGRGLPLLERVIGRLQSVVLGTNGRYLPATFFAHFFKEYEYAVARYQVVQEARDRLDVRIIRRSRFTRETEQQLRRGLADVLGHDMTIRFEFVDQVQLGRTGKAQTCICKIPLPLFSAAEAEAWEEAARREA
ncbi:MAG TPA: glycosyltransferase [Candidatus Binatia bacterium]|nr:glycosyltransferase [Candidatus Binatia bacterium]